MEIGQRTCSSHIPLKTAMPALFNPLVFHETRRQPQRPKAVPKRTTRPFSPTVFANFSDSEADNYTSDNPAESKDNQSSPPRSQRASFSNSPADKSPDNNQLEATYRAPSNSSLGDPIIEPSAHNHRHGKPRTSHDIRRDAVAEIYWHCHRNNLTEVWAYLWNNWYARDRWSLWARSCAHSTCISNHRTTMMGEALWRNLKRLILHNFNRPRLKLALFALVRPSIPPYRKTLAEFLQSRSGGHPQGLSNMQEALKKAWRRLQTIPIKGEYLTNISKWTCDCGTQKYHAYYRTRSVRKRQFLRTLVFLLSLAFKYYEGVHVCSILLGHH